MASSMAIRLSPPPQMLHPLFSKVRSLRHFSFSNKTLILAKPLTTSALPNDHQRFYPNDASQWNSRTLTHPPSPPPPPHQSSPQPAHYNHNQPIQNQQYPPPNQQNYPNQGYAYPDQGGYPQQQHHANANDPAPATAPPPSVYDLERLCQEGKAKQAIELMDNGVKADDARRVFDHMPERNMDSWHLMINEYANNDLGDEGLELFEQMKKLGLEPTGETFHAVLSACASAEAVEEGFLYFEEMSREFGISPTLEHYLSIIDVLGKSAYLNEAVEYIEKLPFEPTVEIWEALRKYARSHGDIDLEDHAEELIVSFDSSKAVANKIPTPPPKKYNLISMLEGKNRVAEFRNPTFYKDDEKLKELREMKTGKRVFLEFPFLILRIWVGLFFMYNCVVPLHFGIESLELESMFEFESPYREHCSPDCSTLATWQMESVARVGN
ncbi:hypothetical protein D5086_006380 [Populus alba]|uniref:Uncharacterized protein n=1 Tax=Populus alba TaxID=43335 RepID=A0ACC4CLH1_POPAL